MVYTKIIYCDFLLNNCLWDVIKQHMLNIINIPTAHFKKESCAFTFLSN